MWPVVHTSANLRRAQAQARPPAAPVTTRDDLVRAVIANPDADAPRAAFADWGIEHGDPQGKLAQIQLEEAHERRQGTTADANLRYSEANALIEKHGSAWARDVLAIASYPRFFRG